MYGLITLQKKIDGESLTKVRWYQKAPIEPIPVPVLGPDLMDPRRYAEITAYTHHPAPVEPEAEPTGQTEA
jgi:NADH-quinone oxidoreductase subunit B